MNGVAARRRRSASGDRVEPLMYPDQARFVARACAKLGYEFKDLNDGAGYLFAVSDGDRRLVTGAGRICVYPLNTAPAYEISRDKFHTNRLLAEAGMPFIESALYFTSDEFVKLRPQGQEIADAVRHLHDFPPPVFCKPNAGSRGDFAEIILSTDDFLGYVERVRRRYDAILIQPIVEGDEYRVFCVDDRAYFCARRSDHRLEGDGDSDLRSLLRAENRRLAGTGVSGVDEPSVLRLLAATHGLSPDHVLRRGEHVVLPGRRNLSSGSAVESFTTEVPAELAQLALRACRAVGLRVGGVDIFDRSPRRDRSDLVIIEVNGNPAISSLEKIGRGDVIDEIWADILRRYFAEARVAAEGASGR